MNRIKKELERHLKIHRNLVLEYYVRYRAEAESPLVVLLYRNYKANEKYINVFSYEVIVRLSRQYAHVIGGFGKSMVGSSIVKVDGKAKLWVNVI